MPGIHRYYSRDGRTFTISAYQIGDRYLGVILTEIGGFHIIEEHVAPGAGAVGATQVRYFDHPNDAIQACRQEIDAQFLWGGMQ